MHTYTVFATYEDNLQPYSATVEAGCPEAAIRQAQVQCLADNNIMPGGEKDYGQCALVGFQVVEGAIEVLPVDDMAFDIGTKVWWDRDAARTPWYIKAFITDQPELRAYIEQQDVTVNVSTAALHLWPQEVTNE